MRCKSSVLKRQKSNPYMAVVRRKKRGGQGKQESVCVSLLSENMTCVAIPEEK